MSSTKRGLRALTLGITCAAFATTGYAMASPNDLVQSAGQIEPMTKTRSIERFQDAHRGARFYQQAQTQNITRVYGKAFSTGASTQASAQSFVSQYAGMWGVEANELIAEGPFRDGHHTQAIGYVPETDSYKFTGHYYKQTKGGIEVFRSKLVLLVRNDADHPLVLASAELHDLSSFAVDPQISRLAMDQNRIIEHAEKVFDAGVFVDNTRRVIYAGTTENPHAPVLADVSEALVNGFEKHLIVTDARTGEVLFTENLIHTMDISGNVSAMATEGIASDECEDEVVRPMPYLFVSGGGETAMTDVDGNYTLSNPGVEPVDVSATIRGQWFEVFEYQGTTSSESLLVTPSDPGHLRFNSSNSNERVRAQVNSYIEANIVRDFAIMANPSYPRLMNEQFPISVNRDDGYCPQNAWYDPIEESINFCISEGSAPNTAWSSIVHHEYGHHLVNAGGSGQGQYGEGMGDVMSMIISDDPRLGVGFFTCGGPLRNGDNNFQYPCVGGAHECGQLISGCVWDTRQEMVVTEPDDYVDILNFLAVNSILVHTGSEITPQITIDWLTLDDDDSDIGNGTPHYHEIAAGFGAHNMDAPELNRISVTFPNSRPAMANPNGSTTLTADISTLSDDLDTSSPMLMVDAGAGMMAIPMTNVSGSIFEANFPEVLCGAQLDYYITAQTQDGISETAPSNALDGDLFSAETAPIADTPYYTDNFETNRSWSVSGNASDGQWSRGVPAGLGERGDPASDFDGSGQCYLTDNVFGNSDVDGGTTTLTSATLNVEGATALRYARWYSNTFGDSPGTNVFVVEISDDDGASWINAETVGPDGPQVSGGWVQQQISLVGIDGFTPGDEFRVRFSASDIGAGAVVEAAIDQIELVSFECTPACIADLTGDGVLDFFDVSDFLDAFGAQDPIADFTGDGAFDFFDVSDFLDAFGKGCP